MTLETPLIDEYNSAGKTRLWSNIGTEVNELLGDLETNFPDDRLRVMIVIDVEPNGKIGDNYTGKVAAAHISGSKR